MYALLTSKESFLPTVISMNDKYYPDLIMSGMYIQEDAGTKKDMQEMADEMMGILMGEIGE